MLVQGKQQEMKELQAEHDRLQAMVEDRNAARLLASGINIQAACPTLPEIETNIRRALTVAVSEWMEEAIHSLPSAVPIPIMVSRVFSECQELVDGIVRTHTAFLEGGDEAAADTFRKHVRRHHRTPFPLTGEHLQCACDDVIAKLGRSLMASFPGVSPSGVGEELSKTIEWSPNTSPCWSALRFSTPPLHFPAIAGPCRFSTPWSTLSPSTEPLSRQARYAWWCSRPCWSSVRRISACSP